MLAAADGSVLGGLSALNHDKFDAFRPERPVVISPMGASPFRFGDAELHWSTYLDSRDVTRFVPHRGRGLRAA